MTQNKNDSAMPRRRFLQLSAAGVAGAGTLGTTEGQAAAMPWSSSESKKARASSRSGRRHYNGVYTGEHLNRIAFPLGGIGAGMICLEGTGALSHFSLRNKPEVFNEPLVFAAISLKGKHQMARVLEGPVPSRKLFGPPGTGNGAGGTTYGLPRFASAAFRARLPFGTVTPTDDHLPLTVELIGWSPFEPGDADNSSLPVAALEYRFVNRSRQHLDAVFSFHARNFMAIGTEHDNGVRSAPGGFVLTQAGAAAAPENEGAFAAFVDD